MTMNRRAFSQKFGFAAVLSLFGLNGVSFAEKKPEKFFVFLSFVADLLQFGNVLGNPYHGVAAEGKTGKFGNYCRTVRAVEWKFHRFGLS